MLDLGENLKAMMNVMVNVGLSIGAVIAGRLLTSAIIGA